MKGITSTRSVKHAKRSAEALYNNVLPKCSADTFCGSDVQKCGPCCASALGGTLWKRSLETLQSALWTRAANKCGLRRAQPRTAVGPRDLDAS